MIFAASCAIVFKGRVHIDIYECRWVREEGGEGLEDTQRVKWRDERQGNVRRNEVVAIQDDILEEIPKEVVEAIFAKFKGRRKGEVEEERVWPTSRNISVLEITERLLEFVQTRPLSGMCTFFSLLLSPFSCPSHFFRILFFPQRCETILFVFVLCRFVLHENINVYFF